MVTKIDRRAWAWHKKITATRIEWRNDPIGPPPLPHDRLALIRMATRRENPSLSAFVTLALYEYAEDLATLPIGDRTAKLPYQLAWARAGWTLRDSTGLPGGIVRARWPDVDAGAMSAAPAPPGAAPVRRQPNHQSPGQPGGLRDVRLGGGADVLRREAAEALELRRTADRPPEPHEQLGLDGMPPVSPRRKRRAHYQRDAGAAQPKLPVRLKGKG